MVAGAGFRSGSVPRGSSPGLRRILPLLGVLAAMGCTTPPADPADLVVLSADVRTVDPATPRGEALAVRDGRFVAVGSNREIRRLVGPDTEVIDAGGRAVLPGFIDGHTHLEGAFSLIQGVDLTGLAELDVWLERIATRHRELEPGVWLVGGRWDHSLIGGEFPTRAHLDAVAPDRPVALTDIDGHASWVNSLALERAGITADTPVPPGGAILLDPETGEPNGILLEGARARIADAMARDAPPTTLDPGVPHPDLPGTLALMSSRGVTGAFNMADPRRLDAYLTLLGEGELPVRIWFGASPGSPADVERFGERRDRLREEVAGTGAEARQGPMLELGFMKLMVDGVLSTHTALLLEPYADRPETRGEPFQSMEAFTALVAAARGAGFPVATHAIGDGAVRMVLDGYAAAGPPGPLPDRVEHMELVHPDDLPRFAGQGVVVSMQPHHAVTTFRNYLEERVGPGREEYAYAWKAALEAGAPLVLGSDWPTAPLPPLRQLWAATRRTSVLEPGSGPWHPEQALTFDEALRGYTLAPAEAAGWGEVLGSITPGKWADFVILEGGVDDLEALRDMEVRATVLAGRVVHGGVEP
jgi:predicted amidohydrolase YtcJ